MWSWGESNPRPSGGDRPCYDHSRVRGSRCPTAGSADLTRRSTDRLSDRSAVFPAASLLSGGHPPLLLPGCGGSAPCGLAAHDVVYSPEDQAAMRTAVLAVVVGAPFSESEQLGSHARPAKLMSKPVSPVDVARPGYRSRRRSPSGLPARPRVSRNPGRTGPGSDGPGSAPARSRPRTPRQSTMPLRWRPRARAASRWASRSAMAWRWSPLRRPRARASSTLARPSRK